MSGSDKVQTFCYQCVNGPDLFTVEVHDGVATRVDGNLAIEAEHPGHGRICVKPYGLVQKTYNPARLLRPMKRTNPRKGRDEDPGWIPIAWDEALELVAQRLNAIRERGLVGEDGNPRVAFTLGGGGTPVNYLGSFPALLAAWGPVDMSLGSGATVKCYHSEHVYGELWHRGFIVLPDTPRCNYIVAFGSNGDASGGVTSVRRHADARVRGLRRVQIEPHLSVTGASASEWVPIRPKADSAFLYAMLHVLLHEHEVEELDVSFLRERTAAPYLIAPNGYYLRDAASGKPLVRDLRSGRALPWDAPGIEPALLGTFSASGVETGADADRWEHRDVEVSTAFERLRAHVKSNSPEWAAPVCDVPAENIRRIAGEFLAEAQIGQSIEIDGRTLPWRPVAILLGRSVNNGWGGYECVWARTTLQTLVGALEVPGGLLGATVVISGQEHDRMASVRPGPDGFMDYPFNPTDREHWLSRPQVRHGHSTLIPIAGDTLYSQVFGATTLAWLRLQGRAADSWPKPDPPDLWFVYRCNPALSFWELGALEQTLAEFPFIVAFAYTLDETNHYADVLLPEATDLESTQLIRLGGTHYFEQFWEAQGWALRQPAVAARGDVRDITWITTELARRTGLLEAYNGLVNAGVLGVPLKTPLWDHALDPGRAHSVEETWDAVCRAASAEVTGGAAGDGLAWYKEHGFRLRPFSPLNWYLYPKLADLGLRFELPYQERIQRIGTELGRRLHEQGIHWWDRQLHEYEALPTWNDIGRLWEDSLADYYRADMREYPFWLLTSRSMQYAYGGNAGIPLINEAAGNVAGHDGVMINRTRAAALGIADGDPIEVATPAAKVRGRAVLREGIRPDVLLMIGQFGHWKTPYAKDLGVPTMNELVPMAKDLMICGTGSGADAVKVSVRRLPAAN
ncbi:MAG: molybdopterin-dependent oxidoreductase [Gammaproteobacteria bacterium]|nr:molybdopterin-dependent oxidoreductase [Gammaproteobacteria bacterium]